MQTIQRRKKNTKKKHKKIAIPEKAIEQLRKAIDSFEDPRLIGGTRGRFCYVMYDGEPLCRLGYKPNSDQWEFAIYKYSTGSYSNSEFLMPRQGTIVECIKTALHAYDLM